MSADLEIRTYQRTGCIRQRNGRSYCFITCPFCEHKVRAFIWSLAGCGRRCPGCNALHTGWGASTRPTEEAPPPPESPPC